MIDPKEARRLLDAEASAELLSRVTPEEMGLPGFPSGIDVVERAGYAPLVLTMSHGDDFVAAVTTASARDRVLAWALRRAPTSGPYVA